MADKDARIAFGRVNWKLWTPLLIGAAVIVGTFLAVRQVWRPGQLSAQAPPSQAAPPQSRPLAPKSGQSGPIAILAVVNGQQLNRSFVAAQTLERYGEEVLETIINRHLILDACRQYGVSVSQEEIEAEIAQLAKKFSLTTDAYLTLLQQERGIDPRQYGRDIIWPTLAMRKLANDQIQVTPEEIRQMLETEIGPRVRARMITHESRKQAEWIREQAAADPDRFGHLAKEHSQDPNSASGSGWIPPIRLHVSAPEIERVAFSMKEGEISPVISVMNQHFIIKCEGHVKGQTPESLPPAVRTASEERIRDHITDRKMREAAAGIFEKLQAQARVQNVFNNEQLRGQMPGVAATLNGRQIALDELAEECIARHGGDVLEGEINRLILMQELQRRNLVVSQADLDAEVIRAAESYGYPSVEEWLADVEKNDGVSVKVYVHDAVWPSVALKKLVAGTVEVTQDDMQKGFEANYGPRVEVLAIVLSNQRHAQEVWEMARSNPSEQWFGELAHQYSIEPVSRANYGRVPPIARHAGEPKLEEVAFSLLPPSEGQPGELSGIVAMEDKFIIMRCLGRTKPEVLEFEVVRDELYRDIHEKKIRLAMAKEFDRLKMTAQIDNYLAGTSQSGQPIPEKPTPRAPAGRIGGRLPFAPTSRPTTQNTPQRR
ncbi:MAG: peptidylprolyl isomerase [Pirellulaceae bacterium]